MRLGMEKRTLEAQMTDAMIERKKLEEKLQQERTVLALSLSYSLSFLSSLRP